nr:hypothetical protein [uncultured Devosia sp.]
MSKTKKEWILFEKETKRKFSAATWVPLRASKTDENGLDVKEIGYISDKFACGSSAIRPEHLQTGDKLDWHDNGIGHNVGPYAYEDGYYSPIDERQYNDRDPIGVELVLEHPQPVVGGMQWILNPDLVVALSLIKEGNQWLRPEEDFAVVAREEFTNDGRPRIIEIKREFLVDYLAARNLTLRLSYYRQRIENVLDLANSAYEGIEEVAVERDDGRFELRVRTLDSVWGGGWAVFRMWRTDVDEDDDAPVMGPENNENVGSESSRGERSGYIGTRLEGEFWANEWIEHNGVSVRVRGDDPEGLPDFIVGTNGERMPSSDLNNEDVGRWLWFRPNIANELLNRRGFSLDWFTADTGGIKSTSGYVTHSGLNSSDLVTVYASDIARLAPWEQRVWAANNVAPEGKVSLELLAAQVKASPADTIAPETKLARTLTAFGHGFADRYGVNLFTHDIDEKAVQQRIARFASVDHASLLTLAKELIRIFADRINVQGLRSLSTHKDRDHLGSIKLLQSLVSDKLGEDQARLIFSAIAGTYDMRVGDAHPTSSKIGDALRLAGIDTEKSFLRQGEQLIHNFGRSVFWAAKTLLDENKND